MKKILILLACATLTYLFQGDIGQILRNLSPGSVEGPGIAVPLTELEKTLALIKQGGPFPNRQDGTVFANRERHLPEKPRGYYREYTVATPGLSHRGARRVVTGGNPPEIYYYTEDHYKSFRQITGP